MTRDEAKQLLPLVNNYDIMALLTQYAEKRIEELRTQVETARTFDDVRSYQGRIHEMRRLIKLQEEIRNTVENGR